MRRIGRISIISSLAALIVASAAALSVYALDTPPRPSLDRPIVDQTQTLSDVEITTISDKINASRKEKEYQLGILIVPTLADESLEGFSLKVARAWGIGEKDKDNGVLLLVAKNDRKLRIEVGRGLEGDLTDVEANRIIRNVITPQFKKGAYAAGVTQGVESIIAQVEGKADPHANAAADTTSSGFSFEWLLAMAFFVLPWLAAIFGRSKSWWAGGVVGAVVGGVIGLIFQWALWSVIGIFALTGFGLLFDFLVSREYTRSKKHGDASSWWAGGGWWGGSGGFGGGSGGGSFGGGGFSGGGSSGSW